MSDDADTIPLELIDQLVCQKTGQPLTELQRLILVECWQTGKKTYEEIATQNNYSSSYIQQRVAPALWQVISQIVGSKVTKSNYKQTLRKHLQKISDPSTSNDSLAPTTHLSTSTHTAESARLEPTTPSQPAPEQHLEFPTESVPLGSRFYLQRPPYEQRCCQLILQPGALIRIKAPRQMGKTSLMNRIIDSAKDYPAVIINFQQTERTILTNLDQLLRWICANISRQLQLPALLDEYWDQDIGSKMSCTFYLEEYLLENLGTPIILALEESSELFEYESISKDFFSMLRTWHEYTKHQAIWKKLRLILVQSTETYVPLNVNQSPFNVGIEVALQPFTHKQVSTLAERSGLTLDEPTCEQLMSFLSGHPYLIRLALYHLAKGSISWNDLFITARSDEGIFSDHLHRHLWNLQQSSDLCIAFRQVINESSPVRIPQKQGFKLHSMGLVTLIQNQVQISCDLYQQYFSEHL